MILRIFNVWIPACAGMTGYFGEARRKITESILKELGIF